MDILGKMPPQCSCAVTSSRGVYCYSTVPAAGQEDLNSGCRYLVDNLPDDYALGHVLTKTCLVSSVFVLVYLTIQALIIRFKKVNAKC